MPAQNSFDYALIRVVPRVEREEFINAGVVLFCLAQNFLGADIQFNKARLQALWPDVDLELVQGHLESFPRICSGDASAGLIARLTRRERFHWLVSPRSTIIQVSPVHSGLCAVAQEELTRLVQHFC